MIAIICTDGQMGIDDLQKECVSGKWIPLLVLRDRKTKEIHLPVFNLEDVVRKFVGRNLPKNWKHGCVYLADDDIATIIENGWQFMPMDFPRKVNEHPDYELSFEIHEFSEEPEFKVS
jgi:hypothetical protein